MTHLIDFSLIENEDQMRQSLNNLNNANHSARSDLFKVAFANLQQEGDPYEVDSYTSFKIKVDLLKRWGIPILNNDGPVGERSSMMNSSRREEPKSAIISKMDQETIARNQK